MLIWGIRADCTVGPSDGTQLGDGAKLCTKPWPCHSLLIFGGLGICTCWLWLLQVVTDICKDTNLSKAAQICHRFRERLHSSKFFSGGKKKQQCECHTEAHTAMMKSSHVCAWLVDVLYPQISIHYKCKSLKAGMSIQPQNASVYISTCCGESLKPCPVSSLTSLALIQAPLSSVGRTVWQFCMAVGELYDSLALLE